MADIRPYRFTDAEIDEWCVAPHGFVWAAGHDHNSWCLAHEVRESRIEIKRLREQFGRQEAFWAEENDALRDEIERLRAELDSQTQWAELMAGNHCYCIPDDVGVCLPCAYRQTMRQNKEARRG